MIVSKPVKDKTGTVTYKVTLKRPSLVGAVNINLDEPGTAFWKGTITVNASAGIKGWISVAGLCVPHPTSTGRRQRPRAGRTHHAELSVPSDRFPVHPRSKP